MERADAKDWISNPDPTKYALTEQGYKPLPKVCPCCKKPYMPEKPQDIYCSMCKKIRRAPVEFAIARSKKNISRIV